MIDLTPKAIEKIKEFVAKEPGKFFRVRLDSGGCSGFEYQLSVSDKGPDDLSYTVGDVTVIIDKLSDSMLTNLRVDYLDSIGFSGFKFENPNATNKCGCGQSFSL